MTSPAAFARALAAVLAACLSVAPPAVAGDASLARFLLDGGKKALEKKQYDDALVKLQKAAAEDPTLAEAHYWIGLAHDRKGDVRPAVEAYRAFRDASAPKAAAGTLPRPEAALLAKANARLGTLAAAETELARLHEAFAAKAIAFAKSNFLREPRLAERAARAILAVVPSHEEAQKLLEKLGGAPVAAAPAGPPEAAPKDPLHAGIEKWHDFIATRLLDDSSFTYEDGIMTVEREGGAFHWPPSALQTGSRYVLEIEARFVTQLKPTWWVGVAFAERGKGCFAVHFGDDELVLWELVSATGPTRDVATKSIDQVQLDAWHRLTVSVDGMSVRVHLDGVLVVESEIEAEDRKDLAGGIGIFHQGSRCEIRKFRMGTPK